MTTANGFLVVGGDSLVGAELHRVLRERGRESFASTRRKETVSDRRIYLDIDAGAAPELPSSVGYAFLVACATNYDRCESDPSAWRTNVESLPRLAASLLERGIFVTFISTNSVFGGERPWPEEDAPHAPGIAYARHKDEGEKGIRAAAERLGATSRLNIVRLTKILAPSVPPLPAWFSAWERGETVQPFSDLIFAPLSVRFAARGLAAIGEARVPGNLHLSGAENVSYVDFAHALARRAGIEPRLIAPTSAVEKGVKILFKPRYSGLGMKRTTERTGVVPQTLEEVVDDLVKSRSAGVNVREVP